MKYAVIYSTNNDPEVRLWAIHRSFKQAQKSFRRLQNASAAYPHDRIGILSRTGLLNYHGQLLTGWTNQSNPVVCVLTNHSKIDRSYP